MGGEPTPTPTHDHDHHDHGEAHDHPTETAQVVVKPRMPISAVWLVPLIALGFGAWLAYTAYVEKGVQITLRFASADGIIPDKTEVRYKGVAVGKVTAVTLGPHFDGVNVAVEMVPETRPFLTDKTLFWRVSAQVSATGVSELQTLLSGDYLAVRLDQRGEGRPQRAFTALKGPPPLPPSSPGLHLVLLADELGSVTYNTKLFHKGMAAGHVTRYAFDAALGKVRINVVVDPDHAALVGRDTHFWNASGIEVSGGINGVTIRSESITSLLAGGIAFDSPTADGGGKPVESGTEFFLAASFDEARMGQTIHLTLARDTGVHEGTRIRYQGVEIGRVMAIDRIDMATETLFATAGIDPRFAPYLSDATRFFVVTPQISLAGITHLDALVGGPYITLRPQTGEPRTEFRVVSAEPPIDTAAPGLHLRLRAPNGISLRRGSPILYHGVKVGTVQGVALSSKGDTEVSIHITDDHAARVRRGSRFWNASGVRFQGGLQGFQVESASVESVMAGGIAFETPAEGDQRAVKNGHTFDLFPTPAAARETATATLVLDSAAGVVAGKTGILYRGARIGTVYAVDLSDDLSKVVAKVGLLPRIQPLLRDKTRFWTVAPRLGLTGMNTDALLGGTYITLRPGDGAPRARFVVGDRPPAADVEAPGLQLTLLAPDSTSLQAGSPVTYRRLIVGQVDGVALSDDGTQVEIRITVDPDHAALVTDRSRFFATGGVTVKGSLAGVSVHADSIASTLIGGLSFFTPADTKPGAAAADGGRFSLYRDYDHAVAAGRPQVVRRLATGLNLTLHASQLHSARAGAPVTYREVRVGEVVGIDLGETADRVEIYINIAPRFAPLVHRESRFWTTSGVRVKAGLFSGVEIDTESMETILAGGIAFATPEADAMGEAAGDGDTFDLHDAPQPAWRAWHPRLTLE